MFLQEIDLTWKQIKYLKNTMVTRAMKYYAETKASYTRDSLGKP